MKNEKGTIVIVAAITTTILMALSAYLLNLLITEIQLSNSDNQAQKAYYLAESGINEAIWKLENNSQWKDDFVDSELNPNVEGEYWSESFKRDFQGGSYEVSVQSISLGEAQITAVAKVPFLGKEARREAKATVFKALDSPTNDSAVFSGGSGSNVQISHSDLIINNGNIFSGHNLSILGKSDVSLYDNDETERLEGKALTTQNFDLSDSATFEEYTAVCSKNICSEECSDCPAEEGSIPTIDFDSEAETSFKSRAKKLESNGECNVICNPQNEDAYNCSDKCLFSSKEFEDLLWEVGEEGLLEIQSDITYINGSAELRGARKLNLQGALVADGTLDLGTRSSWVRKGVKHSGNSHIRVENPEIDKPSGLISKNKINLGSYLFTEESLIEGIIYASDHVQLISTAQPLTINGGIMGRKLNFSSVRKGLEINFNNKMILYGLGYMINDEIKKPVFSPVIEVDHWEEVY
ncbi:MAG: pilus assembly PilX N-terminal domain-containing protein [Patescibacteria group bacterium]